MRPALFALLLIASMTVLASASRAEGDVGTGLEIARENCARCHNIAKGGAFKERPPSFQAIATYRTRDDIWARIIAPSPHSGMPDVSWNMTPEDVQNVLAYIVSLDQPAP
jgi:mono/diheme cytochrome c family protein